MAEIFESSCKSELFFKKVQFQKYFDKLFNQNLARLIRFVRKWLRERNRRRRRVDRIVVSLKDRYRGIIPTFKLG